MMMTSCIDFVNMLAAFVAFARMFFNLLMTSCISFETMPTPSNVFGCKINCFYQLLMTSCIDFRNMSTPFVVYACKTNCFFLNYWWFIVSVLKSYPLSFVIFVCKSTCFTSCWWFPVSIKTNTPLVDFAHRINYYWWFLVSVCPLRSLLLHIKTIWF